MYQDSEEGGEFVLKEGVLWLYGPKRIVCPFWTFYENYPLK